MKYTFISIITFTIANPLVTLAVPAVHQHDAMTTTTAESVVVPKPVQQTNASPEVQTMQEMLKTMQTMIQTMDNLTEKLSKLNAGESSVAMQHQPVDTMPEKPVTPMRSKEYEMRQLLQKIQQTQDKQERKKLLRSHLRSMQEMMSLIGENSSMADHTSHSEHDTSSSTGDDDMMAKMMAKMQKKMKGMAGTEPQSTEQRINELQLLLEQLLQHQIQLEAN
jgi:hypothetical protein